MSLKISISPIQEKVGGLKTSLGYFSNLITLNEAKLIADLLWSFKTYELNALVSTYLFDESKWEKAQHLGWRPLIKKTFTRKGLFPRNIQYDWVVGECPSVESLQEIIYTGWNLSENESFITVLASGIDQVILGIEQTYRDGLETIEENELSWIDFCPYVFSRDHDGLTLRLYTNKIREHQLKRHLELFLEAYSINFQFTTEIL